MTAITITVLRTAGSAPREAGAQMRVGPDWAEGTIGGGALEWQAMARARAMLATGETELRETIALGPALGQCCGGSATLGFSRANVVAAAPRTLWVWGAGHVGVAVAQAMALLPDWQVTVADPRADRLALLPPGTAPLYAADPVALVPHAPVLADHLILTHDHALDLRLCHALLCHGFASCGLIGSATKWARFRARLAALGHAPAQIARIACPIGDPALGKAPGAIALGVAVSLLQGAAQAKVRAG